MKDRSDITEVAETLRMALQKLRGQNKFRGNAEFLPHRKEIRLHKENRASHITHSQYILHLSADTNALWAEQQPGDKVLKVVDFGGDWQAWLNAIVDECRGADYLHTNSKTADYRRPAALNTEKTNEI